MIDKNDILKMTQHVFKRSQGIPDKRLIHAKRDWTIGLIFFGVLLIGGAFMSAQFFVAYQDISSTQSKKVKEIPKYNQLLIGNIVSEYEQRKEEFKILQGRPAVVVESVDFPEESEDSDVGDLELQETEGAATAGDGDTVTEPEEDPETAPDTSGDPVNLDAS